jgi:hypothetical protein
VKLKDVWNTAEVTVRDAKKNMIWLTENANSKIASIGSTTNASPATRITVSKTVFA